MVKNLVPVPLQMFPTAPELERTFPSTIKYKNCPVKAPKATAYTHRSFVS